MKISIFKPKGNRETIACRELDDVVNDIKTGTYKTDVVQLRELYHLIHPSTDGEGRLQSQFNYRCPLPRLAFSAQLKRKQDGVAATAYNALVTLEASNLADYDEALRIRDAAARLPYTLLAFLGASGRSVVIVCQSQGYQAPLPTSEDDIRRFHQKLYLTARRTYIDQLNLTLDVYEPRLKRTVYMSADPDMAYHPQAVPFYIDVDEPARPTPPAAPSSEQDQLMPGRSVKQTWFLNYQFILTAIMDTWFELPDEERVAELLMQIAARCLNEGIPQAIALKLTLQHPALNADPLLVEKTFEGVYAVKEQADYLKRHRLKPLKSIPADTLMMMKTDIFLHTHYDMRKNMMTGVAQYRRKDSEDYAFHDLDDEARNEMTIRAKEMGLSSWDKDIARFIDSPRIRKYDPVNDWLDQLPRWDGCDRVAPLAHRVPTSQPHWHHYLHIWLLGMVAHWQGRNALTGNALVPLLIGRQGCGKSSFCRILLPHELRDYYNDRINFRNDTDLNLGLTSFALINIDEFDKTTQRQQVLLKYLLSTADVKFRPPYGKAYKQYRRYASFIGTTNQTKPLTDPTGSRRFVCVEVEGLIDFADTLDHRQLYAQLKHEIAQGERFWLSDDEIGTLIAENERFQRTDSLVEMIAALFRQPADGEPGQWLSATEVLERLHHRYGKSYLKGATPEKVGSALSGRPFAFETAHKKRGNCYRLVER